MSAFETANKHSGGWQTRFVETNWLKEKNLLYFQYMWNENKVFSKTFISKLLKFCDLTNTNGAMSLNYLPSAIIKGMIRALFLRQIPRSANEFTPSSMLLPTASEGVLTSNVFGRFQNTDPQTDHKHTNWPIRKKDCTSWYKWYCVFKRLFGGSPSSPFPPYSFSSVLLFRHFVWRNRLVLRLFNGPIFVKNKQINKQDWLVTYVFTFIYLFV